MTSLTVSVCVGSNKGFTRTMLSGRVALLPTIVELKTVPYTISVRVGQAYGIVQFNRLGDGFRSITKVKALSKRSTVVSNTAIGTKIASTATELVQCGIAHRVFTPASFARTSTVELNTLEEAICTRFTNFLISITVAIVFAQKCVLDITTIPTQRSVWTAFARVASVAVILRRPYKGITRAVFSSRIAIFPFPVELEACFNVIVAGGRHAERFRIKTATLAHSIK